MHHACVLRYDWVTTQDESFFLFFILVPEVPPLAVADYVGTEMSSLFETV